MAKTQLPHSSGSLGSIPSQGTRPHMLQLRVPRPQLKILPAATETLSSQINKYFTKTKTCPYMKIKSGKPASSGHVLLTPGENPISYVGHHHAHSTVNLGLHVHIHLSSCCLCWGGVEACNSSLLASKSWSNGHFYSFCLVWFGSLTSQPIFFGSLIRKRATGLPVKVPSPL